MSTGAQFLRNQHDRRKSVQHNKLKMVRVGYSLRFGPLSVGYSLHSDKSVRNVSGTNRPFVSGNIKYLKALLWVIKTGPSNNILVMRNSSLSCSPHVTRRQGLRPYPLLMVRSPIYLRVSVRVTSLAFQAMLGGARFPLSAPFPHPFAYNPPFHIRFGHLCLNHVTC